MATRRERRAQISTRSSWVRTILLALVFISTVVTVLLIVYNAGSKGTEEETEGKGKHGGNSELFQKADGEAELNDSRAFASFASKEEALGRAINKDVLFIKRRGSSIAETDGSDDNGGLSQYEKTDDLKLIAATGQRIFVAQTITQIHHGVYKVEALAASALQLGSGKEKDAAERAEDPPKLLRFAFKTECRPAAKWHGQQGWGEVAAHRFTQMLQQHYTMAVREAEVDSGKANSHLLTGRRLSERRVADFENAFDLIGMSKGAGVKIRRNHGNAKIEGIIGKYDDDGGARNPVASENNDEDEPFMNTVGFAAGGILFITPEELQKIVHRDQCGVMNEQMIRAWHAAVEASDVVLKEVAERVMGGGGKVGDEPPSLREFGLLPSPFSNYRSRFESQRLVLMNKERGEVERNAAASASASTVPLYGVFLAWNPNHRDDALPSKTLMKSFLRPHTVEAAGANEGEMKGRERTPTEPKALEHLKQVTEIITIDYILGNEDREDKNWFTGASTRSSSTRLIMMDNGWVFTGRGYKESICGLYEPLLLCPPLFRHLTGSGKCKVSGAENVKLVQAAPAIASSLSRIRRKGNSAVAGGNIVNESKQSQQNGLLSIFDDVSSDDKMRNFLQSTPYPMCRFPRRLVEDLLRFGAAWVGDHSISSAEGGGDDSESAAAQKRLISRVERLLGNSNKNNVGRLATFLDDASAIGELKNVAALMAKTAHRQLTSSSLSLSTSSSSLASFWSRLVRNDLLIGHLQQAHSKGSTDVFDLPLARHTGTLCRGEGGSGEKENHSEQHQQNRNAIDLISHAIGMRIARVLRAVADCSESFGARYVLL